MQPSHSQATPPAAASWLNQAGDFTHQQPTRAVASAVGVGLLIHLLPIGAIVGGLVAMGFALARPALLFLGLWKATELLRAKAPNQN